MSRSRISLTASAAIALLTACAASDKAVDSKTEAQAVRDASMAWLATWQAMDYAGAAAYYAPDALIYINRRDPLVGPAAYEAYVRERAASNPNPPHSWATDTVLVSAAGDMAVELGSTTSTDVNGNVINRGRYVTNWRKLDGNWKAVQDIGVSTIPEKPFEGVFEYLPPQVGRGVNLNGRFVYLIGSADGTGPVWAQSGTYTASGDTITNTITAATDRATVGTGYRWTYVASGDTLEYRILNDAGQVTSRGRSLKVRQ